MSQFEMPHNITENIMENKKEKRKKRIIALSKEIIENQEKLVFSGIDSDSYEKLKADEEEFPGFVTPIDELVQRFKNEGMKLVFGKDPNSGNVFFVPYKSVDVITDSILPKHLEISSDMDARIKELIVIIKS